MSVLVYANEILMLYEGKIIFETGIIKKKTRLFYEIETADAKSCQHPKKRKCHTMITKRFAIKPHDCESIFQIGFRIKSNALCCILVASQTKVCSGDLQVVYMILYIVAQSAIFSCYHKPYHCF